MSPSTTEDWNKQVILTFPVNYINKAGVLGL